MLKLKNISDVQPISNISDFYLKIKILFDAPGDPMCYWSTFGPKQSLIEIGLRTLDISLHEINALLNGTIHKITVVTASIIFNQEAPEIKNDVIKKIGTPQFDLDPWTAMDDSVDSMKYNTRLYINGYYIREKNDFAIYAGKKDTTILFLLDEITLQIINGPVIFGFNRDENLCTIQLQGMVFNDEGFLEQTGI